MSSVERAAAADNDVVVHTEFPRGCVAISKSRMIVAVMCLASCSVVTQIMSPAARPTGGKASSSSSIHRGDDVGIPPPNSNLRVINGGGQPPPPPPPENGRNSHNANSNIATSTSSSMSSSSCSCWQKRRGYACCHRGLYGIHKMGFEYSHNLLAQSDLGRYDGVGLGEIKGDEFRLPLSAKLSRDFRMVIVTRNIYDALVSGYLYHKTGRECWMGLYGELWDGPPKAWSWRENEWNWDRDLTQSVPYVARNNRSICQFLQDESEYNGLRVYIEFAMIGYYRQVETTLKETVKDYPGRVAWMCHEDFVSNRTETLAIQALVDHLFPGGYDASKVPRHVSPESAVGHETSHNQELRDRLRSIIRELDGRVLKGKLALFQSTFRCGKSYFETEEQTGGGSRGLGSLLPSWLHPSGDGL